jgi:hypothetical protein
MKRFQWKWIIKTCCTISWPFRFAMVAILNPKWLPKYRNPSIWAKFCFQVDYDVANWYPNFTGMLSTMSRCVDYFRNFQNGRRSHGNHKKTENLKCSELDEAFQKFCLTCVHIILRLRYFRVAAVATKNVKKFKVLGIGWNLIEMLYGMCINGFEAWKFQNVSLL